MTGLLKTGIVKVDPKRAVIKTKRLLFTSSHRHLAWSKNSCGLAGVVFQQATQSFLITNRCSTGDFLARKRHH